MMVSLYAKSDFLSITGGNATISIDDIDQDLLSEVIIDNASKLFSR